MSILHRSGDHADVLIIGAGPAGGVAALRLAEAGVSVVALEQGHWQDRQLYRGSEWDWELAAGKRWSSDPNVRAEPSDYPIDLSDSEMRPLTFNGVGGGTILYNAIWIRLLPSNFRSRSLMGIGEDWPLSYSELQPFYERTDRAVGVSGLGGNPAWPPGEDPPLPPLVFGPGAIEVARALHQRGWHWWPETNAILSAPYDGRYQCVGRSACHTGCNEGAKSSADLTHWRKAVQQGAQLITGARVTRIVTDERGLACGAEWLDPSGAMHFQSADLVLCAANGIGTPRLLLNSAAAGFPDGLANRSGLVGRRLMMHPIASVTGLFESNIESWRGHFGSTVQCLQFGEHDATRGFDYGAKWSLHPMGGGPIADAMRTLNQHGPGGDFHARFAERFGHGMFWTVMCEDAPEESNRVELSSTVFDSSGMAAPKLVYRRSDNSLRNLDFNVARASEVLRDAGAWRVETNNPSDANAHFMGTARMGDDPRTSVVDRWGMSHDVPNLGIIDASVFVTSGPVNPTSTVCALALRAAERLLDVRRSLPTPARRPTSIAIRRAPTQGEALLTARPDAVVATLAPPLREKLLKAGAYVIPGSDTMPCFADIPGQEQGMDRVLGARPDLISELVRGLSGDEQDPERLLAHLRDRDPGAYRAILLVTASVYFLEPVVRARIGYAGQEARPLKPDAFPAYIAEGLLDHLLDEEVGAA